MWLVMAYSLKEIWVDSVFKVQDSQKGCATAILYQHSKWVSILISTYVLIYFFARFIFKRVDGIIHKGGNVDVDSWTTHKSNT